ncbi:MAG: D-2-hydroxyacid dehydrogenase [Thermoanaerobaculia bacterium]
MRVLVIAPEDFQPLELLRQEMPDVELTVGLDIELLRSGAAGADAVLLAPRYGAVITDLWSELQTVRWIHTLGAGVEAMPFDLLRGSDVVVTNSRGLYADALGEFVIAAMLWFARDLRRMTRNQDAGRWEPFTIERLEGTTVGIIGFGGVGQAIGRRAAAMGMHVLTVRRQQEFGEPSVDEVIVQADYIVMSVPLTPSSHRMMTRERIAAMKPESVFINVGRGNTVDEEALVEALRERRIRGAALDVFAAEPLASGHPLWQLDNVLISPHTADHAADSHERAMRFYIENLRRFRAGEPVENVVDKNEQY